MLVVAGRRVHVHLSGPDDAPGLILIHGASGNLREFAELTARLKDRFRILALDRPGLGHSEGLDLSGTGIEAQARHMASAAASLGFHRPLVLGHSYGGSVALAWALERLLDPAALVLLSAPTLPWPGGELDYWYKLTDTGFGQRHAIPAAAAFVPEFWVRRMVTEVFAPEPVPPGYFEDKGIALAVRRHTLRHNTEQINRLYDELTALQPRLSGLRLPTEILHGTGDRVVPLDLHARPLARHLPAARLTVLEGAGHMPHLTRLDAVEAAILRAATEAGLRPGEQS